MFLLDQNNLFIKRLDDYIDYVFYNNEQKLYIKSNQSNLIKLLQIQKIYLILAYI